MKKIITLSLLFIVMGLWTVQAQRAPLNEITRNLVVVEIGTGTWCQYCPGAANGADDLVHFDHPVAIVENHNGDSYTNDYSNARNNLYAITGYPTANFDGGSPVVGGSGATGNMYDSYVPKVDQSMGTPTSFGLDFSYTDNGDDNFTATINISKVADYDNDVVLHLFVTESNIQQNWQGMTELHFVNRLMVPDQNGTALDFSSGNEVVKELSFDLDASWVRDECEIVVAVQDMGTKEILNGAKAPLVQAEFDYDVSVPTVAFPVGNVCGNQVTPSVMIKNFGGQILTSLDIEYTVNDSETSIFEWTGNLGYYQSKSVVLPEYIFEPQDNNTFTVELLNPNGEADQNPDNNSNETEFGKADEVSKTIEMELYVGSSFGSQISWAFKDDMGAVLAEGSGYSNNELITMELPIESSGCYTYYLYDTQGNGFAGNGYLKLKDNGTVFAFITDELEAMYDIPFMAGDITGIETSSEFVSELKVFPNPSSNSTQLSFYMEKDADISIEVYNSTGVETLLIPVQKHLAGIQNININTSSLENGIYFIQLNIDGKTQIKKLSVLN